MSTAAVAAPACAWCGRAFAPVAPQQRFCGDRCRYRANDARKAQRPEYVVSMRARCRTWAEEHRSVRGRQPWLYGAPPYAPHLPGGGMTLDADPPIGLELNQVRLLHGALTALVGGHPGQIDRRPDWSLLPWDAGLGWGVYWSGETHARRFAGSTHRVRLGHRDVELRLGPLVRAKAPRVEKRGRQRVRIDALTPVAIYTQHRSVEHTAPTASVLAGSIVGALAPRLGLRVLEDDLRIELLERQTEPARAWMGEKVGRVSGWSGHVVLEVNAVARWFLEAAARGPGLGGRVAYGYGRIAVTTW